MKTKGFTLVELLVVIAILAILATVSVVGYTSFIDRANQSNSDTEAHQIESAIESALIIPDEVYEITTGLYAVKEDDAIVLWADEECTTAVTATEFALTGSEDFAGLNGSLKLVTANNVTTLVYVYEGDITTDVLVVTLGAPATNNP